MRSSVICGRDARDRNLGLAFALLWLLALAGCAGVPRERVLPTGATEEQGIARPDAPASYDALVGELAFREGDFAGARDAFSRAAAKDPGSAFLHRRLAKLSLKLERVDDAVGHAMRALSLEPDDEETRLFLARIHRIQLDLPAVEAVLLDADGDPISPEAVLLLSQVYLERTRLADALAITRKLVEERPDLLDSHRALATVYEHMGMRAEAVAALRAGLLAHPGSPVLNTRLARVLRAMGDREAEVALYRDMLTEHPGNYGMLISLGEAQIAANDLNGALETYEVIVSYYPDDLQAIRRYASLEFAAGRYERAAQRLEDAFAKNQQHFELAYSLGQVVRNLGQDDRAVELFELVPDYHPTYIEARLQLASIHEEREDYPAALVEIARLRELRPSRAIDFHMAELLTRADRLDDALALLEEVRAANPDDDEVLYQIGVTYGSARELEKALEYMRLVLEKNPDNPHALNYIGYTFAERGENLEEAERMILRALDQRPDDGYIADSLGWVYYMRGLPLLGTQDAPAGIVYLERARDQLYHAAELTGGDPGL